MSGLCLWHNTECGSFKLDEIDNSFNCAGHVIGTSLLHGPKFALGLPAGFNFVTKTSYIRLFEKKEDLWIDNRNIPIWKKKEEGRIFLRVAQPRRGIINTHVVNSDEGFEDLPGKDVSKEDLSQ